MTDPLHTPERAHAPTETPDQATTPGMPAPRPGMAKTQRDQLASGVDKEQADDLLKGQRRVRAGEIAGSYREEFENLIGTLDEQYDQLGESRVRWLNFLGLINQDARAGYNQHTSTCSAQGEQELSLANGLQNVILAGVSGLIGVAKTFASDAAKRKGASLAVQAALGGGIDFAKDEGKALIKDGLKATVDPTKPVSADLLETLARGPVADVDETWLVLSGEVRGTRSILRQASAKIRDEVFGVLEASEAEGHGIENWEENLSVLQRGVEQAMVEVQNLVAALENHPIRQPPQPYDSGAFRQYVELECWWEWIPSWRRPRVLVDGLKLSEFKKPYGRGTGPGPVEQRLAQLGIIAESLGQDSRDFGWLTSQDELKRVVETAERRRRVSFF